MLAMILVLFVDIFLTLVFAYSHILIVCLAKVCLFTFCRSGSGVWYSYWGAVPLMPQMSTLWDNTTPHPFLVKRGQFSALIVFVLDVALMSILSLWWSLCTRSDISFCAHQFDVATNKTTMKMASFGAAGDGSVQRHCVFCVCFCTCFCIFTCINPWWWHYGRQHAVWMDGTITSCLRRQFSRRWGTPSFLSPGWHLLTFLSLACPVVFLYLELWLYLYLFLHLQTYICDRFWLWMGTPCP